MLLKRVNIETMLARVRKREMPGDSILREVEQILNRDRDHEERIARNFESRKETEDNWFEFDLLEHSRIYHIDQIRKICIDFRLRFLPTRYFKGQIPLEAVSEIKRLEKLHNTELKGFRIIAPSRLFKLENRDDPVLFAPIGNGYFYLIHQWGNDLHPLRKWLVWPFRNVVNLALFLLTGSYLATLLVPDGLFSRSGSVAEFWIIFLFIFKSVAAVVIYYGFALGKNFNPAIWNSKYYNS